MKILIDLTYISNGSKAGIALFAFRLISGILQLKTSDEIVLLVSEDNRDYILQNVPKAEINTIIFNPSKSRFFPLLNGLKHINAINKIVVENKIDIFYTPYITSNSLITTTVPQIGTIHDLQPYSIKKGIKKILCILSTNYIIKKYSKILTISNFVKNDIIKKCPGLKSEIIVIYNSISESLSENGILRNKKNRFPYILNVNTLEPYKNLKTLVKAFVLIKDKIPHHILVKAKKIKYWDSVIMPIIKNNGLSDRIHLIEDNYDDMQMSLLYRNADIFVSPSLMEGFGFTPIEATLAEVPVVCSKEAALYETTMGLLNYYEPATDEKALADEILNVLSMPKDNVKVAKEIYLSKYSAKTQASNFLSVCERYINTGVQP